MHTHAARPRICPHAASFASSFFSLPLSTSLSSFASESSISPRLCSDPAADSRCAWLSPPKELCEDGAHAGSQARSAIEASRSGGRPMAVARRHEEGNRFGRSAAERARRLHERARVHAPAGNRGGRRGAFMPRGLPPAGRHWHQRIIGGQRGAATKNFTESPQYLTVLQMRLFVAVLCRAENHCSKVSTSTARQ